MLEYIKTEIKTWYRGSVPALKYNISFEPGYWIRDPKDRNKHYLHFCVVKKRRELCVQLWKMLEWEKLQPIIRRRCNIFKEELMINRWSPARVEKMLEAGLDVEDM